MRYLKPSSTQKISFNFENRKIDCNKGDTIAAALLASDEIIFRISSQSSSARGPYCMMGVCFECLVKIDGLPNRQACMVFAENGMNVNRQVGPTNDDLL